MESFVNVATLPLSDRKMWCDLRELELPQNLKDCFNLICLKGDNIPGSFEGNKYEDLVFYSSGHSLQEEYIEPNDIVEIYKGLVNTRKSNSDVINLKRFFRVCAENGLALIRVDK